MTVKPGTESILRQAYAAIHRRDLVRLTAALDLRDERGLLQGAQLAVIVLGVAISDRAALEGTSQEQVASDLAARVTVRHRPWLSLPSPSVIDATLTMVAAADSSTLPALTGTEYALTVISATAEALLGASDNDRIGWQDVLDNILDLIEDDPAVR
jgi:hypothetical protein